MNKQLNAVKEFHTAFEIGYSESPKANLGESKNVLRYNLMKEESKIIFNEGSYSINYTYPISDSLVKISKSDISDYINKHKKQFEVEASRDIKFVQFNEEASSEDEKSIISDLKGLLNLF